MTAAVSRSSSDSLHKLEDVRLINKRPCDDLYHRHLSRIKVRSGSFCGLSQAGDSCKGDSGSGLVYFNPRTRWYCIAMSIGGECINILIFFRDWELAGVVSYGAGCNSTIDGKLWM